MGTASFNLLGQIVEFSEPATKYFDIRKTFVELAERQEKLFTKHFNDNFSDLDALVSGGLEEGLAFIAPAVDNCLRILADHEIYEYNEQMIAQAIIKKIPIYEQVAGKILEDYQKIVMSEEEADAARVARREGRGRIIGGGFGVGGALKGMAMAGAANAAIGAMHATFNGVGKVFSSIGCGLAKSEVFNREVEKQTLADAIKRTIYSSHLILIEILNGTKKTEVIEALYTEERAQKAQATLKNLEKFPPQDKELLKKNTLNYSCFVLIRKIYSHQF